MSAREALGIFRSALERHGVGERDVLATLLFGSSAKGLARLNSDIDVIFFIADRSEYPAFAYRRFQIGNMKIDSNIVKPAGLNELCRADVGWSYRLHRALPVAELGSVPPLLVAAWIRKLDIMIESAVACRSRVLGHIRDCRALLRAAREFQSIDAGTAAYLIVEAVFVAPIIFLNYSWTVPFQQDVPWDECLRMLQSTEPAAAAEYQTLIAKLEESAVFRNLNREGSFGRELKDLRDQCRSAVLQCEGGVFGNGYGLLLDALRRNSAMRTKISEVAVGPVGDSTGLIDTIWAWTNQIRERQRARKLPGRGRTPVRHKRSPELAPRHFQYEQETSRLKIILPTGGCKVPTCTFCMLPALARSKTSVEDAITAIRTEPMPKSVRQVTVYTDGSFFDNRELDENERRLVAETVRSLGAGELLVESLPRFLTAKAIENVLDALGNYARLRVGIGVQSTNATVRRYVTRTPITQAELRAVLEWRKAGLFSLRCYLLANKPILSPAEDREDIQCSLRFLDQWLTEADIVTVNPLLPTEGTVVEALSKAGLWRPLRLDKVYELQADLRSHSYKFRLEFGPVSVATCTDLDLNGSFGTAEDAERGNLSGQYAPADAACLPWSVLGGMRHRNHWATKGRFLQL